jgi:hypothetical protein
MPALPSGNSGLRRRTWQRRDSAASLAMFSLARGWLRLGPACAAVLGNAAVEPGMARVPQRLPGPGMRHPGRHGRAGGPAVLPGGCRSCAPACGKVARELTLRLPVMLDGRSLQFQLKMNGLVREFSYILSPRTRPLAWWRYRDNRVLRHLDRRLYDSGTLAQGGNKHQWADAVRQFDVSRSPANRQHRLVGSILHKVDRPTHAKGRNRATPR